MAGGVERAHILEKGFTSGRHAGRLVGFARHGEGFLPGLLDDIKAVSQHFREFCHGQRHGLGHDPRAERAAQHQQADPAARFQRRITRRPRLDDRRAQRVAREDMPSPRLFRQPVEPFETRGNETGPGREHAVHPAENSILLVDGEGNPHRLRHGEGGKGGIAAESGHRIGLPALNDAPGLGEATGEFQGRAREFDRVSGRRARGMDHVHRDRGKIGGVPQAPFVRHQTHLPAARDQGVGGGASGKDVAAGPTGGDQAAARRHAECRRA